MKCVIPASVNASWPLHCRSSTCRCATFPSRPEFMFRTNTRDFKILGIGPCTHLRHCSQTLEKDSHVRYEYRLLNISNNISRDSKYIWHNFHYNLPSISQKRWRSPSWKQGVLFRTKKESERYQGDGIHTHTNNRMNAVGGSRA